jgi:hypothetical protein
MCTHKKAIKHTRLERGEEEQYCSTEVLSSNVIYVKIYSFSLSLICGQKLLFPEGEERAGILI